MPHIQLPPPTEFIREIVVRGGFGKSNIYDVDELLKDGWQLVTVVPRTKVSTSKGTEIYTVYVLLHPDKTFPPQQKPTEAG